MQAVLYLIPKPKAIAEGVSRWWFSTHYLETNGYLNKLLGWLSSLGWAKDAQRKYSLIKKCGFSASSLSLTDHKCSIEWIVRRYMKVMTYIQEAVLILPSYNLQVKGLLQRAMCVHFKRENKQSRESLLFTSRLTSFWTAYVSSSIAMGIKYQKEHWQSHGLTHRTLQNGVQTTFPTTVLLKRHGNNSAYRKYPLCFPWDAVNLFMITRACSHISNTEQHLC